MGTEKKEDMDEKISLNKGRSKTSRGSYTHFPSGHSLTGDIEESQPSSTEELSRS